MDALAASGRAAIVRGSKSFALASRVLAPGTRESAWLLYAWCRHCDDVIDGQQSGHGHRAASAGERRARLDTLYAATAQALSGREVGGDVFAGLQRVVQAHDIPHRFPLDVLDGFAMDVEGRRYRTLDDTLEYCYHVAGAVGIMMAMVMGVRDDETVDRACDLGIAFQLTNIARDIVDDAAAGRIYVPEAWLDDAAVPAGGLCDAEHRVALAALACRLVDTAEPYYASARAGLPPVGFRSSWGVAAALQVYREIGRTVVRRGARAWDGRAVVGPVRKLTLVASALWLAADARMRRGARNTAGRGALSTRRRPG